MDSTEIGNPPEKYAEVYTKAKELGMTHFTGHVGEEGPGEPVISLTSTFRVADCFPYYQPRTFAPL
mgnify:CR=1 FL=1